MKSDFVKTLKGKFGRVWKFVIWILMAFLIASSVRNIDRVSRIRSEVDRQKAKIASMEAQNKVLQDELIESQDISFVEKAIRDRLGLVKEGETEVILPDRETLRRLAPEIPEDQDVLPEPNWKKWEKLFF